jgi:hypothetical protein
MEDQIAAYYAAARANAQEDAAQFAAEDADFSEDDGNLESIGGTGISSAVSTPSTQTPLPSTETQPAAKDDDDDDDEDEEFEDV